MFSEFKKKVADNFALLVVSGPLFYVNIDRDQIWKEYLDGFPDPLIKQEHNCNCCKSFLRQYAGIVGIQNNKVVSIWDNIESEEFDSSIKNLQRYIHSLPVANVFLSESGSCGTDTSRDTKRNVTWNHFYISVPMKYVGRNDTLDTIRGEKRDNKAVLKRSLDELTVEATETILELIAQNSLYKGKEHEGVLKEFLKIQKQYANMADAGEKDNFCWVKSTEISPSLARIRNTAIGTLLINLSEKMELDTAVTKFEQVVAPTNYKRPTAIVTPKMVDEAKKKLEEMNLVDSLDRRYATETDLNVEDILFTDKSSSLTDVFGEMAKDALVNPRQFSKVEEVTIDDFITKIVPGSKAIDILLENAHLPNMVSIITSVKKDAPSLFKWDNNFSWSYTGGITDSIKERVKKAGGNVTGELRVSLSWGNYDDLDLHIHEPQGGKHINFADKNSATSGSLDVDMNAGSGTSRQPVENIIWTDKSRMKEGLYSVDVHNFAKRETTGKGFIVQIEHNSETYEFEFANNPKDRENQRIVQFDYSKTKGLTFTSDVKSSIVSKDKWGLKTNQFQRVNKIMLSPNHWGTNVGNKHYFFILDKCKSDETPRPFFNEFLKQEFDVNRKVFEILGSKIKVNESAEQLSGVGFSDTQNNYFIVNVTGNFKRTLKVKL